MQHAVTFGVGNAFTWQAPQIELLAIHLGENPMKFLSFLVISLSALIFTAKAEPRRVFQIYPARIGEQASMRERAT